jgi:hypothetical protein
VNSSLHSYLILAFTRAERVTMDVGFYYMANAAGRLIGTVLSGLTYQIGGLPLTLGTAAVMLAGLGLGGGASAAGRPGDDGAIGTPTDFTLSSESDVWTDVPITCRVAGQNVAPPRPGKAKKIHRSMNGLRSAGRVT